MKKEKIEVLNEEDRIIQTEYSDVMKKSFVDYAMSVIIARALPDVRDGLKPVQRRVLYDMNELGLKYDKPHRKSARIVGDTMGKYHPHGDSSIYEALVVMTQSFKKGMPLVDGHGNFGTVEGDGAAAMRYTEARLEKITQEAILADLDKDVLDFTDNFDATEKEPTVLPCRFPNLLVNGSEGIAVGMATNIPPHNFGEVVEACKAYMKNNDITSKELMKYIKGPDFPTGGIVVNQSELAEIYETGMGKIKVRGKVEIEELKGGKTNVVVTEIPYTMIGANIAKFLNDVATLIDTKKTNDVIDITNQSNKDGIRIVFELRKDANPQNFINLLYKKTRLEDTFGFNNLAIVDGRPETLSLKRVIEENVKFQFEICTRKYQKLLEKELEKKEIQEGLIRAVNVIDLIIEILRGSKDRNMAKACMTEGKTEGIKFKSKESKIMASTLDFTEKQANAILDMRLYKLIGLELEALFNENEETLANIDRYKDILGNRDSMAKVIIDDMEKLRREFGKERRTQIEDAEEIVLEEVKPEVIDIMFLMDRFGYAKSVDMVVYERNKEAADAEHKFVFPLKSDGKICIFSDKGIMHTIKAKDLPFGKFRDKGMPIDNISNFNSSNEQALLLANVDDLKFKRLVFITKSAMIKVVDGSEFDVSKRSIAATKLNDGDELVAVFVLEEQKNVVLQTQDGVFLRFGIEEVPEKKKAAVGVRGMKLNKGDFVEAAYLTQNAGDNTITYNGRPFDLHAKVKPGHRDTKGTKIRG
ncbi:MAG: DNA topoisomerase 4 subunit A [Lachnospiraceae bacterium]|nr:DNA topoisomerase 4 subunit A [Lachnospiraceae bacterium]